MPRTARASAANSCYHVLNRGNARVCVFYDDDDYAAFVTLINEATLRVPMRTIAYCLMPNHFHLILWPRGDGDVSRWMQWLLTAHVRRHARLHRTTGHIWQGRFKAFPIQEDGHLLTVVRYVERNPLRAGLVGRAEDWPWSSLHGFAHGRPSPALDPGPESARRGEGWARWVNAPMTEAELERLHRSVARGVPFGSGSWTAESAERPGLRPPGRPRNDAEVAG
jgi:putative transposase